MACRSKRRSDWPLLFAIVAAITLFGIVRNAIRQTAASAQGMTTLSIPAPITYFSAVGRKETPKPVLLISHELSI